MAAGNFHKLWPPMPRAERWIDPFHQETARSMPNAIRSEPHGFNTFRQLDQDATCSLRHTTRVCHSSNIIEDVREACWFEIHYLWRAWQRPGEPRNRAIPDRTDVAQPLGKNYIGAQLTQKSLIDCVNSAIVTQRSPHPLVDCATCQAAIVHRTMCDTHPRICFLREIAFMRNANHLIHQAKRRCDLSGSRQKRNDPAHTSFYLASTSRRTEKRDQQKGKKIVSTFRAFGRGTERLGLRHALQNTDSARNQQDYD